MKLKTIEIEGKTFAEVAQGQPVYVHDDGKEAPFDAPHTVSTISRLQAENKSHREGKEQAENALKSFDGITDVSAALEAIKVVQNLDDKKLVDAGEVDRVKAEAIKATEEKYKPIVAERDFAVNELRSEKIGGAFARSKFVAESLAIPSDLVQSQFGPNFSIEDGKTVATDSMGNKIYSKQQAGELAGFEEALSILVDQYPHKDSILKGTGSNGSGADTGQNQNKAAASLVGAGGDVGKRREALASKYPDLPMS